jgi:hypothetical protein
MTSTEKSIIGTIVVVLVVFIISIVTLFAAIDEAGGIRQLIVDSGKEVKSIYKEIQEDE